MADERPIADVIRELESRYDHFPVHVQVNVKEQRVSVTVGRSKNRVGLTFHRTEAPPADIIPVIVGVLAAAGHLYRGKPL